MQIVEINISMADVNDSLNYLKDMQARVIECESWDKYVSYYTEYDGTPVGDYVSVNCGLAGFVLPKMAEVYDLDYDDHKLTCVVYLSKYHITKRIACVVQ